MSHTVTAEIVNAYLLLSDNELPLTGKLQYSLVIFGTIKFIHLDKVILNNKVLM
jgi:hypothetical protein